MKTENQKKLAWKPGSETGSLNSGLDSIQPANAKQTEIIEQVKNDEPLQKRLIALAKSAGMTFSDAFKRFLDVDHDLRNAMNGVADKNEYRTEFYKKEIVRNAITSNFARFLRESGRGVVTLGLAIPLATGVADEINGLSSRTNPNGVKNIAEQINPKSLSDRIQDGTLNPLTPIEMLSEAVVRSSYIAGHEGARFVKAAIETKGFHPNYIDKSNIPNFKSQISQPTQMQTGTSEASGSGNLEGTLGRQEEQTVELKS